jgi:hypothetical protein
LSDTQILYSFVRHYRSLRKYGIEHDDTRASGRTTALLFLAAEAVDVGRQVIVLSGSSLIGGLRDRYTLMFSNSIHKPLLRKPLFVTSYRDTFGLGTSDDILLADEPWMLELREDAVRELYLRFRFVAHTGSWRR